MVSSSSLPASTFEKSRMSLMIVSSASPAPRTPSAYWRWRSSSSVFSSRPVRPMTPFMGVRISWLIVATNADFARERLQRLVAGLGELAPGLALRAQQAGGADERQHQQDARADGQLDRLHAEADPHVDQHQRRRHHERAGSRCRAW